MVNSYDNKTKYVDKYWMNECQEVWERNILRRRFGKTDAFTQNKWIESIDNPSFERLCNGCSQELWRKYYEGLVGSIGLCRHVIGLTCKFHKACIDTSYTKKLRNRYKPCNHLSIQALLKTSMHPTMTCITTLPIHVCVNMCHSYTHIGSLCIPKHVLHKHGKPIQIHMITVGM